MCMLTSSTFCRSKPRRYRCWAQTPFQEPKQLPRRPKPDPTGTHRTLSQPTCRQASLAAGIQLGPGIRLWQTSLGLLAEPSPLHTLHLTDGSQLLAIVTPAVCSTAGSASSQNWAGVLVL